MPGNEGSEQDPDLTKLDLTGDGSIPKSGSIFYISTAGRVLCNIFHHTYQIAAHWSEDNCPEVANKSLKSIVASQLLEIE